MSSKLKDKYRYRFDDFMSRSPSSGLVALGVVFSVLYTVIAVVRVITVRLLDNPTVERGQSGWRQVWIAFLEMTDPGSMTQDVDSDPIVKIFAVLAGMLGLILLSALIAVITTSLDQRLASLRKGHSKVVLKNHSVILGWNERVPDIVRELILANESEESEAIVILSEMDKEEMDDFLSLNVPERLTTKIVTRSGEPSSLVNLAVAAVDSCRSVIILGNAPPGPTADDLERSDMMAIKTLLGVKKILPEGSSVPIVIELFSQERRDLALSVDPDRLLSIDADETLAKILVQTSRNEGLAVVYNEILSFKGVEIYIVEPDHDLNCSFGEISLLLKDGVAMGLQHQDGSIELNPAPDTEISRGDAIIIVAEDDSTIRFGHTPVATTQSYEPGTAMGVLRQERELIIGWTNKLPTIVSEYGDYVLDGSQIDILLRDSSEDKSQELGQLQQEVANLDIRLLDADPKKTAELLALRPNEYDNIIVLSEAGQEGAAEWADSETLLYLLQFKGIFANSNTDTKLIAEILDSRNAELVAETGVREFVISNRLVSMMIAQISEDRHMCEVYDDLFGEAGSEIYLKPTSYYFADPPSSVTFADLLLATQKRNEVAIGVRLLSSSEDIRRNFGVTLVPEKTARFSMSDILSVVVLAEDET